MVWERVEIAVITLDSQFFFRTRVTCKLVYVSEVIPILSLAPLVPRKDYFPVARIEDVFRLTVIRCESECKIQPLTEVHDILF